MVWVDSLSMLLKDARDRNKKLKRLVADLGLDKVMMLQDVELVYKILKRFSC